MPSASDLWFIRYPDGRVVRAIGTAAVRQHLVMGRLPPGTRLRRSLEEDWRGPERFEEFHDLTAGSNGEFPRHADPTPSSASIASRLDATQLQHVRVASYLEDLLVALDSSLVRCKLVCAVGVGAFLGLGVGLLPWVTGTPWTWAILAVSLVAVVWLLGVLSRMTYAELSRLRPARWRDGLEGHIGQTLRLLPPHALVLAGLVGTILLTRWLPGYCSSLAEGPSAQVWEIVAQATAVTSVLLEALAWTAGLLLAPWTAIVVTEEATFLQALRHWARLVRQRSGRLLLAEWLIVLITVVLSLPTLGLFALLGLDLGNRPEALAPAIYVTRAILAGILLAVPLTYFAVANVFISLHLRLEAPAPGK